jgi:hypothetical protein
MRASHEDRTGTAGHSEVTANFERLGWGPVPNPYHDLGTDLFIQVRDERGFDLGLLVGAQVKSGPSAFDRPKNDAHGELEGWWFRDTDRRHVNAWLRHSVPHLIVLHDLDKRVSYWQHITEETVESTGTGAKVFVPVGRTVDVSNREALLEVAGARRPGIAWEGSVWMAGALILPPDRLRHALIVPRLVAPHPNAGTEDSLSAEQAIAMLMQARLAALEAFAKQHDDVPELEHALESEDWAWRFAGALYARAVESELRPLLQIGAGAPTPEARVAASVAAASALLEEGRTEEALPILDDALARDEAATVDHAWLLVQRARARAEIGQLAEAQDDALGAQGVRLTAANDATATAIAASAALLLFRTSSWSDKDLRSAITYADTAANWWRTQTTARGLWATTEHSFTEWSRGPVTTYAEGDPGHNSLQAAALMASHAGDQGAWRELSAGVAQNDLLQLDRHADPERVAEALTELRRAGDAKALQSAVRRIVADGPAAAASSAAAEVELPASTRTSGLANLTLLQHAGDVLDPATAEHTIACLLDALTDPAVFAARTTPTYVLSNQLIETLAGVVCAAGDDAARAVIEQVLDINRVELEIDAEAWARVVRALPAEAWTDSDVAQARDVADRHDDSLRLALLRRASEAGDDRARETLVDEASKGSVGALAALGDVRDIRADIVAGHIHTLGESLRRVVADGRKGAWYFEDHDLGRTLILLNVWHPELAAWSPVLELLEADVVSPDHKRRSLRRLTEMADRIPADIRERLEPIAVSLARRDSETAPGLFADRHSVCGEAAVLAATIGAFDETQTTERLVELLNGDALDRLRALVLIDRAGLPEQIGMGAALIGDPHPEVRATAAALLAARVGRAEEAPLALDALRMAARDPGTRVPEAIVLTLGQSTTPVAQELRSLLRDHRSARVRRAASSS